MFTVELYAAVRRAVMVDGLSHREAARRFGVHRNTISKMLQFSMPPGYRQHPPAAARTDQIAHGVDHLAEVNLARTPAPAGLRHQRRDLLPLLVRQVRRIALGLPGDLGHPPTALLCPHPELESQPTTPRNPCQAIFQTASKGAA